MRIIGETAIIDKAGLKLYIQHKHVKTLFMLRSKYMVSIAKSLFQAHRRYLDE
jgi:hypothetical protein